MNILVVQREIRQAEYIAKGLKESGYSVDYTSNYEEAQHFSMMITYDLAIIDTLISEKSGIGFCKDIKNINRDTGIIFLSSDTDVELKIEALDSGGDDYIIKPFPFIELLARIRAVLRRIGDKTKGREGDILTVKDLSLNYLTREVTRGGKKIELTTKEYILLEYFMRNRNIVLTRTVIKEKIWGIDFISDTNIVDVYVTYLRNKIDKGFDEKLFHTVRGAGYVLK